MPLRLRRDCCILAISESHSTARLCDVSDGLAGEGRMNVLTPSLDASHCDKLHRSSSSSRSFHRPYSLFLSLPPPISLSLAPLDRVLHVSI